MLLCLQHLPIVLYESVMDLVSGEATMLFIELTYTLATEEAERIGVDHVVRMCSNDSSESSLGECFVFFSAVVCCACIVVFGSFVHL